MKGRGVHIGRFSLFIIEIKGEKMKTKTRLVLFAMAVSDFKYGFEQVQELKGVKKKILEEIKHCTKGAVSIESIKFNGTDSGNIMHAGASYFVKLKANEKVLKSLEEKGWYFIETTKKDSVIDAITGALGYHFPYFCRVRKEIGVRKVAEAMADDVFVALRISPKEQGEKIDVI